MSCEKIPEIINNLAYIKSEVNNVTTIFKVSMAKLLNRCVLSVHASELSTVKIDIRAYGMFFLSWSRPIYEKQS